MDVFYRFALEGKPCRETEVIVTAIHLFLIHQGVGLNKDYFQRCFGVRDPSSPECSKPYILQILQ